MEFFKKIGNVFDFALPYVNTKGLIILLAATFYFPVNIARWYSIWRLQEHGAQVEARITDMQVEKGKSYKINVQYAYVVDGVAYSGTKVYPERSYNRYEKDDLVQRLGVDSLVALRYPPNAPQKAVYFMTDDEIPFPKDLLIIFLGIWFIFLSFCVYMWSHREELKK